MKIEFYRHNIEEIDIRKAVEVLHSIFLTTGPVTAQFEQKFAQYTGLKEAIAVNSCTAAIHLALLALGIGKGDEVITTPMTFIATATSVLHAGAKVVFADVEENTGLIDVNKVEDAITPRTKAIMPVHLNGYPADMDAVNAIANKHGLVVIEDACQSHGSLYKGRKTGSLGTAAGFSLNSWKNLGGGDGGLLTTDDEDCYERALMVREFGERIYKGKKREYNSYAMGWMYRTTEFVGAFVRSQLKRLDEMNACRTRNAETLKRELAKYEFIQFPAYRTDRTCVYWFFPMTISSKSTCIDIQDDLLRDKISYALTSEGLRAGAWQRRILPDQSIFRDKIGYGKGSPWTDGHYKGNVIYNPADYPVAQAVVDQTVWLSNMYGWPSDESDIELALTAFDKVFSRLDEVAACELPEGWM